MNLKTLIILFVLLEFTLINTTSAVSINSAFDKENKTLTIYKPGIQDVLMTVQQVSVKPDLVTMEEVFKITSYKDYTFKKNQDFNINWQKFGTIQKSSDLLFFPMKKQMFW